MKEYIERAAVLKVLEEYYPGVDERLHIAKDITSIPTADVAEVRHGRWNSNGIALVCSECDRAFGIVEMFAHYCPWCGARMGEEAEHGSEFD